MSIRGKTTQQLLNIISHSGTIKDEDVLYEYILTEARRMVNADAGSIYVVEGNEITIKYGQNDTRLKELNPGEKLPYTNFSFPINEKQICGYVALTGEPLNIDDCYALPSDVPYKFNSSSDTLTNYHTKSMYTIPLKNQAGKVLGVLQIINAMDKRGNVTVFSKDAQDIVSFFGASIVNYLINTKLTYDINRRTLKMAELRDPSETYPHVERVSRFSKEIYDRYAFNHNIPEEERNTFRDTIAIAAKFHDIGKVGISDLVLKKPGKLTDEEYSIIKGHTCMGAWVFMDDKKNKTLSYLDQMSVEIALHHHERWDGKGYPGIYNLDDYEGPASPLPKGKPVAGEEIPLCARIVSVADVFDALINPRVYKKAWPIEEAVQEIKRCAGTQFDPEVVEAFLPLTDRLAAINTQWPDKNDDFKKPVSGN